MISKSRLGEVLEWKYGAVANTKQKIKGDNSDDPEMMITEWRHPTIPRPDAKQIAADFVEYEAYLNSIEYQKLRAREYPSVQDQLDAIWKGGQAEQDMKSRVDAVKAKYPKPGV